MAETSRTDLIRRRAYELYLARTTERGAEGGDETDDWLAAEREIIEREELEIQPHGPDELEIAPDAAAEALRHA